MDRVRAMAWTLGCLVLSLWISRTLADCVRFTGLTVFTELNAFYWADPALPVCDAGGRPRYRHVSIPGVVMWNSGDFWDVTSVACEWTAQSEYVYAWGTGPLPGPDPGKQWMTRARDSHSDAAVTAEPGASVSAVHAAHCRCGRAQRPHKAVHVFRVAELAGTVAGAGEADIMEHASRPTHCLMALKRPCEFLMLSYHRATGSCHFYMGPPQHQPGSTLYSMHL